MDRRDSTGSAESPDDRADLLLRGFDEAVADLEDVLGAVHVADPDASTDQQVKRLEIGLAKARRRRLKQQHPSWEPGT